MIVELMPQVYKVDLSIFMDSRGSFTKSYAKSRFNDLGVDFECHEEFFTVSHKNVLRGMHLQLPPYDHTKSVCCVTGSATDVLLDLRNGKNYGKHVRIELNGKAPVLLIIPKGVAHGFLAREDNTIMAYKTSQEHAPEYDSGVLWNSFSFDWQINSPIISSRDDTLLPFDKFNSPF